MKLASHSSILLVRYPVFLYLSSWSIDSTVASLPKRPFEEGGMHVKRTAHWPAQHKLRTVQLLYLPECSKTYQGSGVQNRGQPFSEHCSSGSREKEAQSCVPCYVFSSYGTIILPVSRTLLLTHH